MFLLRTAFWLIIVIMILPTDTQSHRQLMDVAKSTISDLSHFCERNPLVCKESKAAFERFKEKAEYSANLLVKLVRDKSGADEQNYMRAPITKSEAPSTNTLSNDDLIPIWEAPSNNVGA